MYAEKKGRGTWNFHLLLYKNTYKLFAFLEIVMNDWFTTQTGRMLQILEKCPERALF